MKKGGVIIWSFLKKHRWSVALISVALLIGGVILWDSFSATSGNPPLGKLRPKPKPTTVAAPISGLQVDPSLAQKRPVAVVIENFPDARPQSGLNQADMIFETFAEGGITRFLAIYQSRDYKEIGPIRSARPYFVEWAASYKAIFAHVGGSEDALALILRSSVYDLNQFANGTFFWRDSKRYAPHNVYSNLVKIYTAATAKKWSIDAVSVPAFTFKKEAESKVRPSAYAVRVLFNSAYAVTWNYDPASNTFKRVMAGVPQTDRLSKEQISAKNLMVCFSDFSYGTQSNGQQKVTIRTTGTGSAIIYIDGAKISGKWRRLTNSDITRFYDASGSEIKLNAGTTWVSFVPGGTVIN